MEIYESKFDKVKYYRGHRVEGVWVFGMGERTNERKIGFIIVENREAQTLVELLIKHVHKKSIIHSDCFSSYSRLSLIFNQYKPVNHSVDFVNKDNSYHTNTIEGN